jgi:hypothetical protein
VERDGPVHLEVATLRLYDQPRRDRLEVVVGVHPDQLAEFLEELLGRVDLHQNTLGSSGHGLTLALRPLVPATTAPPHGGGRTHDPHAAGRLGHCRCPVAAHHLLDAIGAPTPAPGGACGAPPSTALRRHRCGASPPPVHRCEQRVGVTSTLLSSSLFSSSERSPAGGGRPARLPRADGDGANSPANVNVFPWIAARLSVLRWATPTDAFLPGSDTVFRSATLATGSGPVTAARPPAPRLGCHPGAQANVTRPGAGMGQVASGVTCRAGSRPLLAAPGVSSRFPPQRLPTASRGFIRVG